MSRIVRTFIYVCFLMFAVVCAGCSDYAFEAQEEGRLFMTVEGVNGGNLASRSIMPTGQHDLTDNVKYSFTLSGVSNTGKRIEDMDMAIEDAGATIIIPLEPMLWNLTLTAYKTTDGGKIPVLRGFSVADMRTGSASVHFVLSSDGLYGNGTAAIKASIPHNGVVKKVTVGVYKKSSPGEAIFGTEQEFSAGDDGTITLDYAVTVPAGNYLLCISCQNEDGTPCGSYCDTLIVEPGLTSGRDFGTLDIAARLPTAPAGLSAEVGEAMPDGSKYRVTLSWECGQYAERYELQLTTSAETTVYSADGADGAELFAGSDIYGGGDLLYGSKGCVLLLAPGTYTVRLRARNTYGVSSEWDDTITTEVTAP
ncbi:MAG: hypothetical protein K2F89_06985 [Treponemataceae bacterium]|nr:hypothetical protein [Treponemataceae bacterium]